MWTLKQLQNWNVGSEINGEWVPARPINWKYRTMRQRLYEAWAVFIGKADVFLWPSNQ